MAKPWVFCSLLLIAPLALATADLSVVSFSSDKTVAQHGEPITLMARVANLGPDPATNFAVHFNIGVGYPMAVSAPAGWTCSPLFLWSGNVACTTSSFAAGAQADFQTTVLVYSRPGTAYEAVAFSFADPVETNNRRKITVTRTPSDAQADIAITTVPTQIAIPAGQTGTVRGSVTNNGSAAVSNVHLIVFSEHMREGVQVTGSGSGWTCTSYGPRLACRRPSLAAGETAFVDVTFRTDAQTVTDFDLRAIAQKNDDPIAENNRASLKIGFGNATDYKMFLLPLDTEIVVGANGSRWITETTMLLRSSTNVDVRPELCELPILDCGFPAPPPPHPLNEAFAFYVVSPATLGQYVYVPAAEAHKVHVNTRTYDASRSTSTGGAEIPFVSEDDFSSGTTSLLGIPLEPDHRYTLRVYDADGRGGRVLIHVYAHVPFDPPFSGNQEKTPRKTFVATLVPGAPPYATTTTALLPIHPATLQIDPIDGIDLEGVERLRIDIEPLDQGLRLWSFVSITNNETHHVTTVSQK